MNVIYTTPRTTGHRAALPWREAIGQFVTAALVIAVLVALRWGAVAAKSTPQADSVEAVAQQAIDAVNEALATGKTDELDLVFAADVVGHPPHRSLITGEPFSHDLAGLKASLTDMRQGFPDAAITIDEMVASDNTVAARVTFRGTLDAAAIGLGEDASQPLAIGGLLFGRIAEGRVAEFWAYFDLVGALPRATMATPEATMAIPEADAGHSHEREASGMVQAPQPGAEEIAVMLTEFNVMAPTAALRVDQPYTFVVANEGTVPHEIVIERAGAVHEPLALDGREAMTAPIVPGTTGSLSWTFAEPGTYQLACHEPGHYEAGQVATIDVTV